MNTRTKKRLGVMTGIIVIVVIALLAVVGGNSAAHDVTVAEARDADTSTKIKVSGSVVENSFAIQDNVLTFSIYDPEADPVADQPLAVRYEGGVSATFGNGVTAICTGRKDAQGVLECSELVTKCPSKYESAEGALSVAELLGYGDAVLDKPVKVQGFVAGDPGTVEADFRFVLDDCDGSESFRVVFGGALPDDVVDGALVVLTGSIGADGSFTATDVALEA